MQTRHGEGSHRHGGLAPGSADRDLRAALSRGDTLRVFAVNLLWALCYPLIAIGLAAAPPLHFAALRALLAGVVLLVAAMLARRPLPKTGSAWLALAAVGLTTTAFGFGGMFTAGDRISPGLATVLSNSQPLLAAVLGAAILSERLTGRGLSALLAGFGGIVLVAAPRLAAPAAGAWLAGAALVLLAALGIATGNVLLKRLAGGLDPGWQWDSSWSWARLRCSLQARLLSPPLRWTGAARLSQRSRC